MDLPFNLGPGRLIQTPTTDSPLSCLSLFRLFSLFSLLLPPSPLFSLFSKFFPLFVTQCAAQCLVPAAALLGSLVCADLASRCEVLWMTTLFEMTKLSPTNTRNIHWLARLLRLCLLAAVTRCIPCALSYEDDGNFHPLHVKPHHVYPELVEIPRSHGRRLQSQCSNLGASDPQRFSPPCCGTEQDPCCEPCFNMTVCSALTNRLIEVLKGSPSSGAPPSSTSLQGEATHFLRPQDRYYPTLANLGSCDNLEDRVKRLDIFGPGSTTFEANRPCCVDDRFATAAGRTFREEAGCRQLVYDYVCLFWASEASDIDGLQQYENRCSVRPTPQNLPHELRSGRANVIRALFPRPSSTMPPESSFSHHATRAGASAHR
eukprot:scaffold7363_cov263-Pinguiococcus_pyrenoidosus.AAC.23